MIFVMATLKIVFSVPQKVVIVVGPLKNPVSYSPKQAGSGPMT